MPPCDKSLNCCLNSKAQESGRKGLGPKSYRQSFLKVRMERAVFLGYSILTAILWTLHIMESHIFCIFWLLSLSLTFSSFIHATAGISTTFSFLKILPNNMLHFIYLLINWRIFWFFPLLWIMMLCPFVYKFLRRHMLSFLLAVYLEWDCWIQW